MRNDILLCGFIYFSYITDMAISIQEHKVRLAESQKMYINEKVDHIFRYLGKLSQDETVEAKVVMTQEDTKSEEDKFVCEVTLFLPHKHTLRCEVRSRSPESAIDEYVEKLKKQTEKIRTKIMG